MKTPRLLTFILPALILGLIPAERAFSSDKNELQPVMAELGKVHLALDFNEDFTVKKGDKYFLLGQGTTWEAKDGMLVGTESSPEYQAKKKAQGNGHLGTAPRLQAANSPKDVIIKYSFKIVGGKTTALLPMIEAGHHLRRVYLGAEGSKILAEHERTTVAESDFVLKTDTWHHIMIEIKDDEFLVRFQDGPTLYGKHKGVGAKFENYNIGITATDRGVMHIDNMMRFLLDTNLISELRHTRGDLEVKRRFARLEPDDLFVSVVVFGELTNGIERLPRGRRKRELQSWLSEFETEFGDRLLPFDREAARV